LLHLLTIAGGLLEVNQRLQRRIRRHKRCGWALERDSCKVEREKQMEKEFKVA
jgi:ribosomal protein S9